MHYSLAVSLGRGNRTLEAEAEAAYLESVRLNPEHADALNNLCLLLAGQGRHVEAEAQCRRAIEVRPTHAKAMSNLGMTLQAQEGKMAEAEAWHRRCVLIPSRYSPLGSPDVFAAKRNGAVVATVPNTRIRHEEASWGLYQERILMRLHGMRHTGRCS
jgi:Flp pilus assembly protein TadD